MLTPIITLIVGGSILFVGIWSLTGLGSNRLREAADRTKQGRSEVGSVIKISHLDRSV